jgi:Domain of unknown function (DU1801)
VEKSDLDPDAYLASLPPDRRGTMTALDALIREALPSRPRTVWTGTFWGGSEQTIIGYGSIAQSRPRGPDVEWFAVGLALQKAYVSLYVNAVDGGRYLTQAYGSRLGKAKVGSASVSFRRLEDVDVDALTEMLRRAGELTGPRPEEGS